MRFSMWVMVLFSLLALQACAEQKSGPGDVNAPMVPHGCNSVKSLVIHPIYTGC